MLRHLQLGRLLFFLLALSCLALPARAQVLFSMIPDSLNGVPSPDTVNFGDTTAYRFSIQNGSNSNFNDSIYIHLRTSLSTRILAAYDTINIPAQSSVFFSITDSVLQARYGGGVSIVVIWPTSPTPILVDSLKDTIFVGFPEVVGDPYEFDLQVFPNPTQQYIYFSQGHTMAQVRELRLTDALGRVILTQPKLPRSVDLSGLARGVYYLTVHLETGTYATFRVVKD